MQFARLVIDLLLLRQGPQDMPGGTTVLYGAAAAYFILLFLQTGLIAPPGSAIFQALVASGVLAAYTMMLVRVRGYPHRGVQTLSALFASGAAIKLLMLGPTLAVAPFFHALGEVSSPAQLPKPSAAAMLAFVVIFFWGVAVTAHIYRHALSSSFWLGLASAVGYVILLQFVLTLLAIMR